MRLLHGTGRALLSRTKLCYLLRDEFTTALAAGSVNGTAAMPGPGMRTVVDTGNDLSIAGGVLLLDRNAGAWGDPGLWHEAQTRTAGMVLLVSMSTPLSQELALGFGTAQAGVPIESSFVFRPANSLEAFDNASGRSVGVYAIDTWYSLAVCLRTAGAYAFIKGGAFTNWTLLWIGGAAATATLYPCAVNRGVTPAFSTTFARIPDALWLPVPLCYDAFTRANGAIGSTEATGPDSQATPAQTWNNRVGTTQISGNAASASALVGGIAIATVDTGTADVLHSAKLTRSAGNVGIVVRYADADNYVYAIHDGTNTKLIKRVATVETTVITAVTAYAAGAVCRIVCEGASFSLYYNNAKIGSTSTISNAGLQGGTEQGLYTSDTGNSQDNFETFARAGNTYAELDKY